MTKNYSAKRGPQVLFSSEVSMTVLSVPVAESVVQIQLFVSNCLSCDSVTSLSYSLCLNGGFAICTWQEKEAKKEAFRKYLESSGVLDALTKGDIPFIIPLLLICNWLFFHFYMSCLTNLFHLTAVLVALYEQNDKPSSALE